MFFVSSLIFYLTVNLKMGVQFSFRIEAANTPVMLLFIFIPLIIFR